MPEIARLSTAQPDFAERLKALTSFESTLDEEVGRRVREILADVRSRGDAAVLEHTKKYDELSAASVAGLELARATLKSALAGLPRAQRDALAQAAARIRKYHQKQLAKSWQYAEPDGTVLGQRVTPLDRVGLYVPGGKAAYPSSVLMTAIPAKIAGVRELVMCVPAPRGERNALVLAAAATGCSPSAERKPWERSPTARRPFRGSTRSWVRETPTSPRRSARYSGRSEST